jgi:hypothetical protein
MDRHLIVLSCSATKVEHRDPLPAISRYDGPYYKVLNSCIRERGWPRSLSIAVLSAEYGLIGGLTQIDDYDRRMDERRATELREKCTETLVKWSSSHSSATLVLGRDYLPAINFDAMASFRTIVPEGPIGMKLQALSNRLHEFRPTRVRKELPVGRAGAPLYFLPDWDDLLDADFDFRTDSFSAAERYQRKEQHCIQVMQPRRMCDGVLVSLAQNQGTKGILRRVEPTDLESLAPQSIRTKYGLRDDQWAFGDCGAFSYSSEPEPTISTEQAVSLYHLHGFDLGASVDHIPLPAIEGPSGAKLLTTAERRRRIALTRANAREFLEVWNRRKCSFTPVGIIQGIAAQDYARQLPEYVEMGYSFIALGGLVPRSDSDIEEVVRAVAKSRTALPRSRGDDVRLHLFGVFRPKLQASFRECGISSFDSATYFRKAWLRSDQNYLGADGQWYAAVRVPMMSDARTRKRLEASGLSEKTLRRMEKASLEALHEYGAGEVTADEALAAVHRYDELLSRGDENSGSLYAKYRRTLEAKPWQCCGCPVCKQLGIDVLIFRGYNRNKRRGAHNTYQLYRSLREG